MLALIARLCQAHAQGVQQQQLRRLDCAAFHRAGAEGRNAGACDWNGPLVSVVK